MAFCNRNTSVLALAGLLAGLFVAPASAQVPVATYQFNNTLAADQAGKPTLISVDPLGMNQFESATVYGNTRQVFDWDGNTPPAEQAGLSLDTTGLIPSNNYSVEMVFNLSDRAELWRRILDVQNRASDAGFYVDPNDHLDVFPIGAGSTLWTNDTFHHVVLSDANTGTVKGYLDGNPEFTLPTNVMDINNPGNLLNFFLDNNVGGGIGEFSNGQVALVRLYDTVLTDDQVRDLAADPFGPAGPSPVPEPCSLALLAGGALPLGALLKRRRNQA